MLRDDSPLRRLPAELNPLQALFLNGMRQNAEIAFFAYERLRESLTAILRTSDEPIRRYPLQTGVFTDAWAVIDAIDRFRTLRARMPHAVYPTATPGEQGFAQKTQAVRDIRNFNDHIGERAAQIVASGSPALGAMTWVTVTSTEPFECSSCLLAPGSVRRHQTRAVNPADYREFHLPTDKVHLEAGGVRVDLSQVVTELRLVVEDTENAVTQAIATLPPHMIAATDLLIVMRLSLKRR